MSTSQLFVLLFMVVRYVYKMFEHFNIAFASVEIIQFIGVCVCVESVSFARVSLWPFRLIFLAIVLLRKLGHPSAIFVHFLHSLITKGLVG